MAELAPPVLTFLDGCPDCGERHFTLPDPLPAVGDDFDWELGDYDSFRRFMLQELIARFPERTRWTAADVEVVIIEALAAVLDQLSDMADRVAAEAYLQTARRPESVRRLLALIGYDAVEAARDRGDLDAEPDDTTADLAEKLDALWLRNPHLMDAARRRGPRSIHTQYRMVTVADYATRMEDHPLVERSHAHSRWTGSWTTIFVTVVGTGNLRLDDDAPPAAVESARLFHRTHDLPELPDDPVALPPGTITLRSVLRPYVDALRMAGREVILENAVPVPIMMSLSVGVADNYFHSEVRRAIDQVLGTGPEGFFAPGRLRFGEDLVAGDVIEVLMAEDGVANVCLNRFKRLGNRFPDESSSGRITLEGSEIAICDNAAAHPSRGYYRLTMHGGIKG